MGVHAATCTSSTLCVLLMLVSGCDDGSASAPTITFRVHNRTSDTLRFGHELFIDGHTWDLDAHGVWNDEPTIEPCEGSELAVPTTTMDTVLAPYERGILRWKALVVQGQAVTQSTQQHPGNDDPCNRIAPIPEGSYDVSICPSGNYLMLRDDLYCPVFYGCQTTRVRVSQLDHDYDVMFTDDDVSVCGD